MITAIEIENFKGIRERMRMEFGPVTLLFGPNSAGKSSVLHAFHLAREVFSRRNLNVDRTELGDEFIDLGGFLHFVHGRDPDSVVTLRFDLDLSGADFLGEYPIDEYLIALKRFSDDALDVSTLGDDIMSGWVQIKLGWSQLEKQPFVMEYSVGIDKDPLATISALREGTKTSLLQDLNLGHPLFRWPELTDVEDFGAFGVIDYLYPYVQSASQAAYLGGTTFTAEELQSAVAKDEVLFADVEGFPDERRYRVVERTETTGAVKIVLYREPNGSRVRVHSVHRTKPGTSRQSSENGNPVSLQAILHEARSQYDESETPLVRINGQDGALPDLSRELSLLLEKVDSETDESALGLDRLSPESQELVRRMLNRLPSRQHVFQQVLSRLLLVPGRVLSQSLSQFRYIGPVRDAIPRNFEPYRFSESKRWAGGLAAWEELTRSPEGLCAAVSSWMGEPDRLDTGYSLRVDEFRELTTTDPLWLGLLSGRLHDSYDNDDIQKLAERIPLKRRVVLVSTANNQVHQPQDVGQGITQAVPVLVAALCPTDSSAREKGGLVAIEQPELHLNPRQQAALGDVFLHAALSSPKNRLILETHSEHLILRIQRRIRESGKGEHTEGLEIASEDIAVYHVSSETGRTCFRLIEFDKHGDFIQPWPDDFFEIDFFERFPDAR